MKLQRIKQVTERNEVEQLLRGWQHQQQVDQIPQDYDVIIPQVDALFLAQQDDIIIPQEDNDHSHIGFDAASIPKK